MKSKKQSSAAAVEDVRDVRTLAFRSGFDGRISICHSLSPADTERLIADLYAALINKSDGDGDDLDWQPLMHHFALVMRADGCMLGLFIQRGSKSKLVASAIEVPSEVVKAMVPPSAAAAVALVLEHHAHAVIGEATTFEEARAKAAEYAKAWKEGGNAAERCGCTTIETPAREEGEAVR